MDIDTTWAIQKFFPVSRFGQVYFEAIANAFDAGADKIKVRIVTDGQRISPKLIVIEDNGIGFTDERFEQFRRLQAPRDAYHQGVGRLVYLAYFSNVQIVSVFGGRKRTIAFSAKFDGEAPTTEALPTDAPGTVLRFTGFNRESVRATEDTNPETLKRRIIDEFMPLFHKRKQAAKQFEIEIALDAPSEERGQVAISPERAKISLNDIPVLKCVEFTDSTVARDAKVQLFYLVRRGRSEKRRLTAACIDERSVPINLGLKPKAIPSSVSVVLLFESTIFTGKTDTARQKLVLADGVDGERLIRALRRRASAVLNAELPEIGRANARIKREYEDRYPHLIGLFDNEAVGLITPEEAVNAAQWEFIKRQKEVLDGATDETSFAKSLEVSSRSLAGYVLYRDVIIRHLKSTAPKDRESVIHKLIAPQSSRFDGQNLPDDIYRNNVWLLDDKFMGFRTVLSEATMETLVREVTSEDGALGDQGRPDISLIFSADPFQSEKVDVVVVELKRRGNDYRETMWAISQLVMRAQRIADHCPNVQRVYYFAIIDIDEQLERNLRSMKWIPLYSRKRVFYQDYPVVRADGAEVPTPFYLLSFDAVVEDAAARNRAFLELLKSDFQKARCQDDSPPVSSLLEFSLSSGAVPDAAAINGKAAQTDAPDSG